MVLAIYSSFAHEGHAENKDFENIHAPYSSSNTDIVAPFAILTTSISGYYFASFIGTLANMPKN